MNRYITIELYSEEILVFTEDGPWREALKGNNVAEWIWQFAPSPEVAKEQHYAKHDQWWSDVNAGLPEKETY